MLCLRKTGLPGFGRFEKIFLAAVGSVGGGVYVAGGGVVPGEELPGSSGVLVQARLKTGLCRVAAAGTIAWELVRGALSPFSGIKAGLDEQEDRQKGVDGTEVSIAGKIATVLANLTADSSCREALISIGGGFLVKWLMKHATDEQGTIEQEKSEEVILNFLNDDHGGGCILSSPKAVPQLLVQAAKSSNSSEMMTALESALERIPVPRNVSQDDIRDILTLVKGRQCPKAQHMATLYLAKLCESSVTTCQEIAEAEGGKVLCGVAETIFGLGACAQFKCDLARLMLVIARDCPSKDLLSLDSWVHPLLYMLADAAATEDANLAHCSVQLIAACVNSSITSVHKLLERSNLWPLLRQFGKLENFEFQMSAANAIAALSLDGVHFPDHEFDHWTKQMLVWMLSSSTDESLSGVCCRALTGLSSSIGVEGLHVARRWLGELIIALSDALPDNTPHIPSVFQQVVPSYARFVAAEVQGLTMPGEGYSDPLDHIGESVLYKAAQAMTWMEEDGERGTPTSRALKILCDLVAESSEAQDWLVRKGVLPLMKRLAQHGMNDDKKVLEHPQHSMEEQIGRSLALLSRNRESREAIISGGWVPWLEERVHSNSIRLASSCMKTLVHLEGCQEPCSSSRRLSSYENRVFHDGIHIFNPLAQYCWELGNERCKNGMYDEKGELWKAGKPLLDVVFVHGIRGSAFSTWRKDNVDRAVSSDKAACWPSAWLAKDVPQARLLGIEYAAPISRWEGNSAPFKETAQTLLKQLMDAGVGSRPVVFVSHSMGGILVKEMLAHALQETSNAFAAQFVRNIQGLVFYSTPHHGTWLARVALNLKHVGASPAQSLNFLKPGPYHADLNRIIQEWSEIQGFPILHFSESEPTQLLPVIPKMFVVPPESACPGFGESVRLLQADHIRACKPAAPDAISYSKTMELILDIAMKAHRG